MSLADTLTRLERQWDHDARHDPPWPRWAIYSAVLDLEPAELRRRLADRDRTRSGAILAALVELASRHGDRQAAELVTIALLPRMVAAEQRGAHDTYDQLAGLLWEAVVTATNPQTTCLRECIERNAWRRKRVCDRRIRAVSLDASGIDHDRSRLLRRRGGDDPTAAAADSALVLDTLRQLRQTGRIAATTHDVLVRIAHGADTLTPAQSAAASRKQRQRALRRAQATPAVRAALIA